MHLSRLGRELAGISDWLKTNKLSLSIEKSKYMIPQSNDIQRVTLSGYLICDDTSHHMKETQFQLKMIKHPYTESMYSIFWV